MLSCRRRSGDRGSDRAGPGGCPAAGRRPAPPFGRLSFSSKPCPFFNRRQPADLGWPDDTIVFFNDSSRFEYCRPAAAADARSGVVCHPNNFDYVAGGGGCPRASCARPGPRPTTTAGPTCRRRSTKRTSGGGTTRSRRASGASCRRWPRPRWRRPRWPTDMFTPAHRDPKFTGRLNGAIYGSPVKSL